MENVLISFCFTTYKRREYLQKTLKSVLLQSYPHFEVIVSDNDPEQSGKTVVESFNDPRFKYFANSENVGMKKSFNKSLERSRGEYIVMIADDDPVYPDMLETLLSLKEKYPGYGLYLGGCNWFCTEPKIAELYSLKVGMNSCLANMSVGKEMVFSSSEFLKNFFNFKIFPSYLWSTGMVKRTILEEKGGVPDYDTAFLGDYAYLSIMASHSGCVVINTALGHQTIHEQNFGRSQNEQIGKAVVNFIKYVSERINHVEDWPEIRANMERFVSLWVVTHLAFLKRYYEHYGNPDNIDMAAYEKEIFDMPQMKNYKLKYYLKTRVPELHNFIVKHVSNRK